MRRLAILLLVIVFLVALIAFAPGENAASSENTGAQILNLIIMFVRAFDELGGLILKIMNEVYAILPEGLRCLFGLAFLLIFILCVIGLSTLRAGKGLWGRYID
jgi:hypothetical protein